jgi:hypothetical protein
MRELQNWQNPIARSVLDQIDGERRVGWAKFFDITASREDLHVDTDCIHFCVVPALWAPVHNYVVDFYENEYNSSPINVV